jgi:hypothetical protein
VKVLAWFSLGSFLLGLLIAASPFLLLLAGGEDSEGYASAGWVLLFITVPAGLLLIFVAIILILIAGIRGLVNGGSRLFGILAIAGAGGTLASAVGLILLITNNLMVDYTQTTSPLALTLFTGALLIMSLVATFVLAFSSPTRFVDGENSPAEV